MITNYAFLWYEQDAWHVQLPYGPSGTGASQEEAFQALREALHERRLEIQRRTPPPSPFAELLQRLWTTTSKQEREREEIAEIERFGLDDCLLIAPKAFAALLEEQCTRLTNRDLRRRRLLGHEAPRPVCEISDHPFGSWLRRHRILWITSELYDLQVPSHWMPETASLFAFDGSALLHLDGRIEQLQALLQVEQPSLDDVAPAPIAQLVAEAVGRRGKAHHSLATVESLERMEEGGDFVLDRRELARISPLPAASLETNADGWVLRFATSFGELGMDDEIYEWRVEISRRFDVRVQMDLLSSRIFTSRPFVIE